MRRSWLAVFLMTVAAVLAGNFAMASPAHANFLGPVQNYGNGLCMQPAGNSAQSGTLIVQEP